MNCLAPFIMSKTEAGDWYLNTQRTRLSIVEMTVAFARIAHIAFAKDHPESGSQCIRSLFTYIHANRTLKSRMAKLLLRERKVFDAIEKRIVTLYATFNECFVHIDQDDDILCMCTVQEPAYSQLDWLSALQDDESMQDVSLVLADCIATSMSAPRDESVKKKPTFMSPLRRPAAVVVSKPVESSTKSHSARALPKTPKPRTPAPTSAKPSPQSKSSAVISKPKSIIKVDPTPAVSQQTPQAKSAAAYDKWRAVNATKRRLAEERERAQTKPAPAVPMSATQQRREWQVRWELDKKQRATPIGQVKTPAKKSAVKAAVTNAIKMADVSTPRKPPIPTQKAAASKKTAKPTPSPLASVAGKTKPQLQRLSISAFSPRVLPQQPYALTAPEPVTVNTQMKTVATPNDETITPNIHYTMPLPLPIAMESVDFDSEQLHVEVVGEAEAENSFLAQTDIDSAETKEHFVQTHIVLSERNTAAADSLLLTDQVTGNHQETEVEDVQILEQASVAVSEQQSDSLKDSEDLVEDITNELLVAADDESPLIAENSPFTVSISNVSCGDETTNQQIPGLLQHIHSQITSTTTPEATVHEAIVTEARRSSIKTAHITSVETSSEPAPCTTEVVMSTAIPLTATAVSSAESSAVTNEDDRISLGHSVSVFHVAHSDDESDDDFDNNGDDRTHTEDDSEAEHDDDGDDDTDDEDDYEVGEIPADNDNAPIPTTTQ